MIALWMFAGCGTFTWLDQPFERSPDDWPQLGGGADRSFAVKESADDTMSAGNSGDEEWDFSLDGAAGTAAPLMLGDMLLLPSVSATVEAVRLSDGEKTGEFSCEWFIEATPAVLDDRLFVATVGSESPLLCFSLRDGSLQWSRVFEPVQAALCVHGGSVYTAGIRGHVVRFDPEDSVEVWKSEVTGSVRAAPAAADTLLVVGTETGDIIALSAETGATVWRVPTFSAIQAGPVIADGLVVAANRSGVVTAVDLHDGSVAWEHETGSPVYYAPAHRDGRLLIPLASGNLLLLRVADGTPLHSISIGELPGASPLLGSRHAWQLARKGALYRVDVKTGDVTRMQKLPERSETQPIMTSRGILLIDEEGDSYMVDIQ